MAKKTTKIATQTQTKKSNAWFVLALIALGILVVNIVFVLAGGYQWAIEKAAEKGVQLTATLGQETLFAYSIMWLVLAIITVMLIIVYKQKKIHAWWLMLILGIVILFTSRVETAVLLIIASFLYKGNLK